MKDILLLGGFRFVRSSLRSLINSRLKTQITPIEKLVPNQLTSSHKNGKTSAPSANDAADPKTAIKTTEISKPSLIILDVSIPQSEGLETFLDTKQMYPNTPILIINGSEEFDFAANYLRLGCNGYISKNYGIEEILEGIQSVGAGKIYVRPEILHKKSVQSQQNKKVHDALSKRELQVFFKLANGKSILNVANDLNISTSTVSVFRSKILKKMQFKNNADLILYAKDQHCLNEFS